MKKIAIVVSAVFIGSGLLVCEKSAATSNNESVRYETELAAYELSILMIPNIGDDKGDKNLSDCYYKNLNKKMKLSDIKKMIDHYKTRYAEAWDFMEKGGHRLPLQQRKEEAQKIYDRHDKKIASGQVLDSQSVVLFRNIVSDCSGRRSH